MLSLQNLSIRFHHIGYQQLIIPSKTTFVTSDDHHKYCCIMYPSHSTATTCAGHILVPLEYVISDLIPSNRHLSAADYVRSLVRMKSYATELEKTLKSNHKTYEENIRALEHKVRGNV